MIKKITSLIIITSIILSISACSGQAPAESHSYSFDDSDIIAYINGEPVFDSEKEQYIFMAKQFYQAVADAGKESGSMPDSSDVFYLRMAEKTSLSDAEWDNEYYRTFVNDIMIKEFVKDKDGFSGFLSSAISQEVKKATDKIEISIYNDTTINYGSIVGNVAEHFGVSYDECVEKIYKPFISDLFLYDFLVGYFIKYKYTGKQVEWDGTNKSEYAAYLSDAYAEYDEYIDKLLSESEIVFRPSL